MVKASHDSPSSSSSKSKVKQKISIWERKRMLVHQRLSGLDNKSKNREESFNTDRLMMCYEPKESVSADIHHSSVCVTTSAMERAEEVRANLSPQFPCFLKHMLKSHVTGGFWLGLPIKFCLAHLSKQDEMVGLVDENGGECYVKYLAGKRGLSGGWRNFSTAHKLVEGDVLVFQLIQPHKFKIYIVRASRLTNVDGATNLVEQNFHAETIEQVEMGDLPEENPHVTETGRQKCLDLVLTADQSGNDRDNSGSQVMDGIVFSKSLLNFKDVKGIEDFKVHANGQIIDSEIPMHLRSKYYELCCSQNMFLHENLISGLNSKLIAGMISETINIVDAIRAAKPSTDPSNLESWDRTLKAFEDIGMVVGFLRTRIHKLLSLVRESQAMIQLKRAERGEAEEEMRVLSMKLLDVEKRIERVDAEVNELKVKNEGLDAVFKAVGGAPW